MRRKDIGIAQLLIGEEPHRGVAEIGHLLRVRRKSGKTKGIGATERRFLIPAKDYFSFFNDESFLKKEKILQLLFF